MLTFIIWTGNPDIFSAGPFQFRWLTVLLILSLLCGRHLLFLMFKWDGREPGDARLLFIYLTIGALIGSRIIHVLFFEPALIASKPYQVLLPFDFSNGFRFTGTQGFSSLGGIVGVMVALLFYARKKRANYWFALDASLIVMTLVIVSIRLGDLFNSDNYGAPTDARHGMIFASRVQSGLAKLPCCVMRTPDGENPLQSVVISKGSTLVHQGTGYHPVIIYLFFKEGGTEQLVNEFLIGDVKGFLFDMAEHMYEPGTDKLHYTIFVEQPGSYTARIQTIGIARHPVQIYEATAFVLLFLGLLAFRKRRGPRLHPGDISAVFLSVGMAAHFAIDFLKESKAIAFVQMHTEQALCIPLFLFGVVAIVRSWRAGRDKI